MAQTATDFTRDHQLVADFPTEPAADNRLEDQASYPHTHQPKVRTVRALSQSGVQPTITERTTRSSHT